MVAIQLPAVMSLRDLLEAQVRLRLVRFWQEICQVVNEKLRTFSLRVEVAGTFKAWISFCHMHLLCDSTGLLRSFMRCSSRIRTSRCCLRNTRFCDLAEHSARSTSRCTHWFQIKTRLTKRKHVLRTFGVLKSDRGGFEIPSMGSV